MVRLVSVRDISGVVGFVLKGLCNLKDDVGEKNNQFEKKKAKARELMNIYEVWLKRNDLLKGGG